VEEIKAKIRDFLGRYIRNQEIADDEDMFTGGYVNSLFVMQLVLFVEQELRAPVEDDDLDFDNFRSIDAVAAFVAAKTGHPQPA
jgi:acyl carrier protein